MTFQPDTSQSDQILGPLLLGPAARPAPAFSAVVHPIGPAAVRVEFSDPVDDSALSASSWSVAIVSGTTALPSVSSVSFYDSDRRSVVVSLSFSLTYGAQYSLAPAGVFSYYGDTAPAPHTFTASVPDPPRAIDAVMAGNAVIDVIFDRPVGQWTLAATGVLSSLDAPVGLAQYSVDQAALTMVPWSASVPANNIRFTAGSIPSIVGQPVVSFRGVRDQSMNVAGGTVKLSLRPAYAFPYAYSDARDAQVIDAFVDSVSDDVRGPGRAFISAYFNRAMLAADVTDTSKWTVSQQGSHPMADAVNAVVVVAPFDLASLVAFLVAFRTAFEGHIAALLVHPEFRDVQDEAAVVLLAADLRAQFNAHVRDASVHLVADPAHAVTQGPPVTFADAIALLNAIKLNHNIHRSFPGVHVAPDPDQIVTADAFDAASAATLADEIRSKVLYHVSSAIYHVLADTAHAPTVPYSSIHLLPIVPVTLADGIRAVEESVSKYHAHALDVRFHSYPDTVNSGSAAVLPTDISSATAEATLLRTHYNAHLAADYPISVILVRDRASPAVAPPPVDDVTYFAQISISADSHVPSYKLQCNIRSDDLASTTPATVISVRSGSSAPMPIAVQSTTGGVTARFDRSIGFPDLTELSVTGPGGARSAVSGVRLRPSLQSLFLYATDLMDAYTYHNLVTLGAGHKVLDAVNVLLPGDYPACTLTSVIMALNRLKAVYSSHARSTAYHYAEDPVPVPTPDAVDLESAILLASTVAEAFFRHNVNVGAHFEAGARFASRGLMDTLEVSMTGCSDGGDYVLDAEVDGVLIDARNGDAVTQAHILAPFTGRAIAPYVSSIVPEPGVLYTGAGPRMVQDAVRSYFTRPMLRGDVDPASYSVSPSGPVFGESRWLGRDSVSTAVSGMVASAYSADLVGLRDAFGNGVGKFTPPSWLIPVIPSTSQLGVPISAATPSFHFGDGRAAAYVSFDMYEDHVAYFSIDGTVPLRAYLYDRDMALLASFGPSVGPLFILDFEVNLTRGPYVLEITVDNPLDTDTADVVTYTRFDTPVIVGPGNLYLGVLGVGDPSIHVPGGYANYRSFVADAATTYAHMQPDTQLLQVWVMDGVAGGTVVASGSGIVPFTVIIPTVALSTYVVEVAVALAGPDRYFIEVNDLP